MAKYQPRHAARSSRPSARSRAFTGATMGAAVIAPFAAAGSAHAASSADPTTVLNAIKSCESGGNYTAQNPSSTASGGYQFLDTTWRGLAAGHGYARALNAPKAVQDAAALELYKQAGTSPWIPSQPCWGPKLGSSVNVVDTNTGGTNSAGSSSTSTTSGSPAAGVPTAAPGTPAFSANPDTSNPNNPPLRAAWQHNPFPTLKLTRVERKALTEISAQQAQQSWWTPQARAGRTVTRHVVTSGISTLTHEKASYASASVASLKNDEKITGHYVNLDWFEITKGDHAGQFVNTSVLHLVNDKVQNGRLDLASLANVPSYLRAAQHSPTSAHLNFTAAKQLIWMDAAYRAQFGTDLKINEGYRTLDTQNAYYAKLGSHIAATPGESNHGLGLAIDVSGNVFANGTPGSQWINTYGSFFGFNRPAAYDNKQNWEEWHVNFVG